MSSYRSALDSRRSYAGEEGLKIRRNTPPGGERDFYVQQLEGKLQDTKAFLNEYMQMHEEKDQALKYRENEIIRLKSTIETLENQVTQEQKGGIYAINGERAKSEKVMEKFEQKLSTLEDQVGILERQLLDKNRYIVELEQRSKDAEYMNLLVQEKQVLIDSLRRENEVLMKRIRESFREQQLQDHRFDHEEERRLVLDIIKKKEAEGYSAEGFKKDLK